MRVIISGLVVGILFGALDQSPVASGDTDCDDVWNDHDTQGTSCPSSYDDYSVDNMRNEGTLQALLCLVVTNTNNINTSTRPGRKAVRRKAQSWRLHRRNLAARTHHRRSSRLQQRVLARLVAVAAVAADVVQVNRAISLGHQLQGWPGQASWINRIRVPRAMTSEMRTRALTISSMRSTPPRNPQHHSSHPSQGPCHSSRRRLPPRSLCTLLTR